MKNISKVILFILAVSTFVSAQQAWKVGQNILGTNIFMTGKVSTALADTATCDTTNAANTIYSAVLSNSVYLLSGKTVQVGYVVIDTSKTLSTGNLGPIVSVDVQGSLDGITFQTVVDSAVSAKRWLNQQKRTGVFQLGTATLTNLKFPYWRLALRTTGSLGTAGAIRVSGRSIEVPKFRYVIVP